MTYMSKYPVKGESVEYNDNRVSLFAAQQGRCAVTGKEIFPPKEVLCHHKQPREMGGNDRYANLTLVLEDVHTLIHAKKPETINAYKRLLNLNKEQMEKVNKLRIKAGREPA